MREFAFEQALCAHLEDDVDSDADRDQWGLVSRQLGASVHGSRVVDVIQLEPGPGFDERVAVTAASIPAAAIESDVGPGEARYWKDAFDCHPERARRAVQRAVEVGFFEPERRNGRTYVRQAVRYPDWVDRLRGVENKPDLDRPGDLGLQLRRDVALGLLDEVVLATASYVTGAHLNRIPDEVGVWRFDPGTGEREVVREPGALDPDRAGIEVVEQRVGRTDIRVVTAEEKTRQRRHIAERAYGKGWRVPADAFPACERIREGEVAGGRPVPHCEWKGRIVDPGEECGCACPGFEPGAPPDVDPTAQRARRTAWDSDPAGRSRRQARLDTFDEDGRSTR